MEVRKTIHDDFFKIELQESQKSEFCTEITDFTYTFLKDDKPVAIIKAKPVNKLCYLGAFIGKDIGPYGMLYIVRKGQKMMKVAHELGIANRFTLIVRDGFIPGHRLAKILGFKNTITEKNNATYYKRYYKCQV